MGKRSAETIRVAGGLEVRWMARRGLWQVRLRYRHPATRKKITHAEIYVDARDEEEARELGGQELMAARIELTDRLDRAHAGTTDRASAYTLEDFFEEVWKERAYPNLPKHSKDGHDQQWGKWICPYLGGFTLKELGEDGPHIGHAWIEWMQELGAGVPTIEKVSKMARGYLTRAMRWGYLRGLTENPFAFLELPTRAFEEEVEFALELEHACRIAWLMPGPLRHTLWTELIACGALRQEELTCTIWSDFYLPGWKPRRHMRITKAVSGKGSGREIKDLKSRSSGRRTPDMWEPFVPLLNAVREQEKVEDISQRVFRCGSWDGLPDIDNWRDDFWSVGFARSGVEQDGKYGHITPHRLRGAAASALAYAGEPRHRMLEIVGHTQETTTIVWYQRAYDNPDPELYGMKMPEQIQRARKLALPYLRAVVDELVQENATIAEQFQRVKDLKSRRKVGADLRRSNERMNYMAARLRLLEQITS